LGDWHLQTDVCELLYCDRKGISCHPSTAYGASPCIMYVILPVSFIYEISDQYLLQAPITVQGCHGKLSSSWAAPDLSFAEQYIGFDLNLEIRKRAENLIRDALNQYLEHRRLSGSSVVSESSENEAKGVHSIICLSIDQN
jgi:hypothetical protein